MVGFCRSTRRLWLIDVLIWDCPCDSGWLRSIAVQLQAVRQVKLYASGLSFTLHCEMLPSKSGMIDAYKRCAEELTKRAIKLRARG
jgi:hypothetical protein